jgi:hypothetical protein
VADDAVTYQPVSCIEFPDTGSNRQADSIREECAHAFRRAPTAPVACEIIGKLEVFALYKQLRNLKVEQVPIGKLPPYAKNAQKPSFFNRLGGCSLLKEQGDDHWLAGTGAKFPEQGNFSILGLFLRFPFQIDEQIQSLAAKFPTQWNRECFCTDQGI